MHDRLPGAGRGRAAAGAHPVWLCDPMHGNTVKLPDGRKTRAVADVVAEVPRLRARPCGPAVSVRPDCTSSARRTTSPSACLGGRTSDAAVLAPVPERLRSPAEPGADRAGAGRLRRGAGRLDPARDGVVMATLGDDTLTPAEVAGLARRSGATLVLDQAAEARMRRSVAVRDLLVASGEPIYGVTTGFGDSSVHQIVRGQGRRAAGGLIRYHLDGSGPTAPDEVVRATHAHPGQLPGPRLLRRPAGGGPAAARLPAPRHPAGDPGARLGRRQRRPGAAVLHRGRAHR